MRPNLAKLAPPSAAAAAAQALGFSIVWVFLLGLLECGGKPLQDSPSLPPGGGGGGVFYVSAVAVRDAVLQISAFVVCSVFRHNVLT